MNLLSRNLGELWVGGNTEAEEPFEKDVLLIQDNKDGRARSAHKDSESETSS